MTSLTNVNGVVPGSTGANPSIADTPSPETSVSLPTPESQGSRTSSPRTPLKDKAVTHLIVDTSEDEPLADGVQITSPRDLDPPLFPDYLVEEVPDEALTPEQNQNKTISYWRLIYGERAVNRVITTDVNNHIWEPIEQSQLEHRIQLVAARQQELIQNQQEFVGIMRETFGDALIDAIVPADIQTKIMSRKSLQKLFELAQTRYSNKVLMDLQDKFIAALKKEFGDEIIDELIPDERRATLWTESTKAIVLYQLQQRREEQTQFFESNRHLVQPRAFDLIAANVPPGHLLTDRRRDALIAQVFNTHTRFEVQDRRIARLNAEYGADAVRKDLCGFHTEYLISDEMFEDAEKRLKLSKSEQEIGADTLDRVRTFLLKSNQLPLDEIQRRECIVQVCMSPEGFFKMADEGLSAMSTPMVKADPVLWSRLQAAGSLPIDARIALLGEIVGQMERAKDFWSQVDETCKSDLNTEQEIETVVRKYFSLYANGVLVPEAEVFDKIKNVLERQRLGLQIGSDWEQILSMDSMEAAHRGLPNKLLLKKAITAQVAFERELSRLKKIDGYYRYLNQKVDSEIQLLTLFTAIPKDQREDFIAKLSKKDQTVIKELQKKAIGLGKPLSEIVENSIEKRKDVGPQILDIIQDLERFPNTPSYAVDLKYLNPNSSDMRMLSVYTRYYIDRDVDAVTEFRLQFSEPCEELENQIKALNLQIGDGSEPNHQELVAERARLKALQAPLIPFIHEMQEYSREPDPISEVGLYAPLKDYHIIPIGEPLLKDNKGNPLGKWIIVRLAEVRDPIKRAQITSQQASAALLKFLEEAKPLDRMMPNESVYLKYEAGVFSVDPDGDIEICFEDSREVFDTHDSRDLLQRSRREEISPGMYKRRNKEEIQHFKGFKNWKRGLLHKGWSDDRVATAGPDRLEAILTMRSMAQLILSGRLAEFPQAEFQNIGEYFDALMHSELSVLPGSYADDPLFLEAWDVFGTMRSELEPQYRSTKMLPYLEAGLSKDYKWDKENTRIMQFTKLFESYIAWRGKILEFINEMEKEKNQKIVKDHPWLVPSLKDVLVGLSTFIGTLPQELHAIIDRKNEIMRRDTEVQAEWIIRRDQVGAPFAKDIEKAYALVHKLEARDIPDDAIVIAARAKLEAARARYDAALAPLIQEKKEIDLKREAEIDGLWLEWRGARTPEEIEMMIYGTLAQMAGALNILTPSLVMLSIPLSSKSLTDSLTDDLSPELEAMYNETAPKAFQNKVKIHDVVLGDVMEGTEPSALWLQAARCMEIGDNLTAFSEFMRSRQAKERLSKIMA